MFALKMAYVGYQNIAAIVGKIMIFHIGRHHRVSTAGHCSREHRGARTAA